MASKSESLFQPDEITGVEESLPRQSEVRRMISVFFGRPLPVIGLAIIILFILTAIFAPWIVPHDPYNMDPMNKLQSPSREHLLGTDAIGRDTLSRVIYGSRVSLIIGLVAVSISTTIGVSFGLIAAYAGGWANHVIMRLVDGLMAFPMILLALVIASLIGGGIMSVIVALTIGMVAPQCRITCGVAMSVKENDYILVTRAIGMGHVRTMITEILPNCFAPILVTMTIGLGATILAEAGLSFLGVGVNPPTPVWGRMVNEGYKFLLTSPMLSFAPGLAVMLVVFGFNMMGDGLRDALDPRLRGVV